MPHNRNKQMVFYYNFFAPLGFSGFLADVAAECRLGAIDLVAGSRCTDQKICAALNGRKLRVAAGSSFGCLMAREFKFCRVLHGVLVTLENAAWRPLSCKKR